MSVLTMNVYDRECPYCGAPLRSGEQCLYCDYQDPGGETDDAEAETREPAGERPPAPDPHEPDLGGEAG